MWRVGQSTIARTRASCQNGITTAAAAAVFFLAVVVVVLPLLIRVLAGRDRCAVRSLSQSTSHLGAHRIALSLSLSIPVECAHSPLALSLPLSPTVRVHLCVCV